MKKNILIAVLVLTNLFSLAYAFVQRAEAMRQAKAATEIRRIAKTNDERSSLLLKECQQK
jgi:hypothetical protein